MRETILNPAAGQSFHDVPPCSFARPEAWPDRLKANLDHYPSNFPPTLATYSSAASSCRRRSPDPTFRST
jgi:hypothetical protein